MKIGTGRGDIIVCREAEWHGQIWKLRQWPLWQQSSVVFNTLQLGDICGTPDRYTIISVSKAISLACLLRRSWKQCMYVSVPGTFLLITVT